MINTHTNHKLAATAALLAALAIDAIAATTSFEPPVPLAASNLLAEELLTGPNYSIREVVMNDGYMDIYTIESEYGQLRAVSTTTIHERIHEFNAMAAMEKLEGTEEFVKSFQQAGKGVIDTATGAVTNPIGTVTGALSGVGRLISTTTDSLTHQGEKSETEGDSMESLIGKSKVMRQYAYEFGVDPYSRNEYLQAKLREISQAGFLGSAMTSIGLMAVPGAAGAAVGALRNTRGMNERLRDSSAADLRAENRKALHDMGMNEDIVDLFIGSSIFTPTEQTVIVTSLQGMDSASNRQEFIKAAVLTTDPDAAVFRQRQATMYAAYDRDVGAIDRFHPIGEMTAARTNAGTLLIAAPMDRFAWTPDTHAFVTAIDDAVNAYGFKGKEIWLSGIVSNRARGNLQNMGWTVRTGPEPSE